MSFIEIEAELERLSLDELRRLALKSCATFVGKRGGEADVSEADPRLLAALDAAVAKADATPGQGHSGGAVRARLGEWTSR